MAPATLTPPVMKRLHLLALVPALAGLAPQSGLALPTPEPTPPPPRFSVGYMDRSVEPGADFYRFAAGSWLKANPVPADKSRWSGFEELAERNWRLIQGVLEECTADRHARTGTPKRQVGDFYRSAMDTNRLERLAFKPLAPDLRRIAALKSGDAFIRLVADFHLRGIDACFNAGVSPDEKNSAVYAFHVGQGGLGLPDRDFYLSDNFAKQREAYRAHVARMLSLLGDPEAAAAKAADLILELETTLAKASKSRTELRDPIANYHKLDVASVAATQPNLAWRLYLADLGVGQIKDLVVRQPDFFATLQEQLKSRPLSDWQTYLRWHLVRSSAPYLHRAAEDADFAFYGTVMRGQPQPEPRWQRAAHVIDRNIGEALGQLYVERYFPPAAKARMNELIANLREVFRDRLARLEWMGEATRAKALAKFDRFTQKIGHPDTFRDYSKIRILPGDYLGNLRRCELAESHRQLHRVGQPVDRAEWHMTPQTVNAYFNPSQNEIVFPAGILQPPFFDVDLDDAVNYGAIGVVIGHEITHGYDDQGRKFDADGNLNDWWTEADAKAFDARARKLVEQYNGYEPLPGLHVNGELTLGENIADLGGTSIAYEALQRALKKNPALRRTIDGFTPEQRFFLSMSQVWRTNWREAELKRRLTLDPHSPGQYRAIGAHVNLIEFYEAFRIEAGAPMWREPQLRARIW